MVFSPDGNCLISSARFEEAIEAFPVSQEDGQLGEFGFVAPAPGQPSVVAFV